MRYQHILFVPILLVARLSWCIQSILFPLNANAKMAYRTAELWTLGLHYAWVFGAAFALLPVGKALLYVLTAELSCGVLLSFVFIMSHNGMEVYDDGRNFMLSQMASTRNIDGGLFNDWFTGGLNRQSSRRRCARSAMPSSWCASSAPSTACTTRSARSTSASGASSSASTRWRSWWITDDQLLGFPQRQAAGPRGDGEPHSHSFTRHARLVGGQ